MMAADAAWICLGAPLAEVVLFTVGSTRLAARGGDDLATASVLASFVAAVVALFSLWSESPERRQHASTLWEWLTAGSFHAGLRILVDPLSVFMMLVVAGVGFLIVAYSIGYMDGDD